MQFGLDPQNAMTLWSWASWLWPFVLPLGFVLATRSRIKTPVAFLVVGALVCFGVYGIVAHFMISLPAAYPESAAFPEQLFQIMLAAIVRTNVIAFLLSFLPLTWLYVVLRAQSDSSLTQREETQ